jgi:hypothetical protein
LTARSEARDYAETATTKAGEALASATNAKASENAAVAAANVVSAYSTKAYADGSPRRVTQLVSGSWTHPGFNYDPGTTPVAFVNLPLPSDTRIISGTIFSNFSAYTGNAASIIVGIFLMDANNVERLTMGGQNAASNASPYAFSNITVAYQGAVADGISTAGWYIQVRLCRDVPLYISAVNSQAFIIRGP